MLRLFLDVDKFELCGNLVRKNNVIKSFLNKLLKHVCKVLQDILRQSHVEYCMA